MHDGTRIPTLKLWNLLLVPLQGDIDDRQGEQLCQDVLTRIEHSETAGLIIDVTGLWLMDSHLCSVLSTLASAAALMGTRTVLSGLSPEIAITLQTMGLDMPDVSTVPCLEDALETLGIGPTDGLDESGRPFLDAVRQTGTASEHLRDPDVGWAHDERDSQGEW